MTPEQILGIGAAVVAVLAVVISHLIGSIGGDHGGMENVSRDDEGFLRFMQIVAFFLVLGAVASGYYQEEFISFFTTGELPWNSSG